MFRNPQDWYHIGIIKLGEHKEIHRMLSVAQDYASYADFFAQDGSYKLRDEVRRGIWAGAHRSGCPGEGVAKNR